MHGQWSSVSLGIVDGRKLIFFGGGDSRCYAFEALRSVPPKPVKLKTVWSYDCIPDEYKSLGGLDWVTHYCAGDKRKPDGMNTKSDGTYVGLSEIIGTPVFYRNRIYVAIGRDPEHGRGRTALHCIDATQTGDITKTGRIWTYRGLDRTLSTVSIADGLLYISDVGGRLHCRRCRDRKVATGCTRPIARSGVRPWWPMEGSYMPSTRRAWTCWPPASRSSCSATSTWAAPILVSPVAANGTLYIASTGGWLWAVGK